MSDEKTLDQLWAEHDALASNPVVQARFAQANHLHECARPSSTTAAPDAKPADPHITEYRELAKTNPVLAARRLLRK